MAKTKKAEITTTAQEDLTAAVNQARERSGRFGLSW